MCIQAAPTRRNAMRLHTHQRTYVSSKLPEKSNAQSAPVKLYEAPQLIEYGPVEELTTQGASIPGHGGTGGGGSVVIP